MNILQITKQLRFRLKTIVWPGSAIKVFHPDSILVTNDEMSKLVGGGCIPPIAAIRAKESGSDPDFQEEPGLLRYGIDVEIATTVDGDRAGQGSLLGANASGTTSEGRGLLEFEEQVSVAFQLLTSEDGVSIISQIDGTGTIDDVPGRDNWVSKAIQKVAWTTLTRFFHPPIKILAVDAAGAGDTDITWRLPPARFDFFNVRLVRKAGSSPPASETDGTNIFETTSATAFTDSPGAGTFTYGLFTAYDEIDDPPDSQDTFSAGVSSTVVVT